ncbi:MAG: hypothetical protein ACR2J6_04245 [Thermoleophilaceae bacterium]
MIVLRALVRVLGLLLVVALALIGAAVAIFSIQGGDTGLSMPVLADLVGLPRLGASLDGLRAELEASGPIAVLSALGGLAAILLGVLLVCGAITPRRPRSFTLDDGGEGKISARRRPLSQLATALALRAGGVTSAKVRARPGRRRGGVLKITAERTRRSSDSEVRSGLQDAVAPLAGALGAKTRAKTSIAERGARVQ